MMLKASLHLLTSTDFQRTLASNYDPNRDHTKLVRQQTRDIKEWFSSFSPHIAIDMHEYGASTRYSTNYSNAADGMYSAAKVSRALLIWIVTHIAPEPEHPSRYPQFVGDHLRTCYKRLTPLEKPARRTLRDRLTHQPSTSGRSRH
jgi:hypothetical protein